MNKTRILMATLAMMVVWFTIHAILLQRSGLPFQPAAIDAGIFSLLLGAGAWVSGTILLYYRPDLRNISGILAGNAILALGIVYVYINLPAGFIGHESMLKDLSALIWLAVFLLLGMFSYFSLLWLNEKDRQEADRRREEMEMLSKDAELAGLRLQLQPHFLFNSLNSVSAMLENDPGGARRMIFLISGFLRGTIRKDPAELIRLEEELEHLRLYAEIEQVRFAGRLLVDIRSDGLAGTMMLPALILQPLVENAIKFGLYGTSGKVTISLHARAAEKMLHLSLSNPISPEDEGMPGTGFGLDSVRRRLQLIFNRPDLLEIHQESTIFTVNIRIPQHQ